MKYEAILIKKYYICIGMCYASGGSYQMFSLALAGLSYFMAPAAEYTPSTLDCFLYSACFFDNFASFLRLCSGLAQAKSLFVAKSIVLCLELLSFLFFVLMY